MNAIQENQVIQEETKNTNKENGNMKTVLNTSELRKAVKILKDLTTSKKINLPICRCLKIGGEKGKPIVIIEASNLNEHARYTFDADIVASVPFIIELKQIENILKSIKEDKIIIEHRRNKAGAAVAYIETGFTAFELLQQDAEDFPVSEKKEDTIFCTVETQELIEKLELVDYCVNEKEDRKELQGILFELTNKNVTIVGCDGKRLSSYNIDTVCNGINEEEEKRFILSLDAIKLIKKIKSQDTMLFFNEKSACVVARGDAGFIQIDTLLIAGNYPNYRQVTPASFAQSFRLKASELLERVKSLKDVSTDSESFLNLEIETGEITLFAESQAFGKVINKISADIDDVISFRFNVKKLFEVLKTYKDNLIEIKYNDSMKPVGFSLAGCNGGLAILMPLRNQ